MQSTQLPACKDCKWCQLRPTPYCFHPQSLIQLFNPYLATFTTIAQTGGAMRSIGACGPSAKLYQQGESNAPLPGPDPISHIPAHSVQQPLGQTRLGSG